MRTAHQQPPPEAGVEYMGACAVLHGASVAGCVTCTVASAITTAFAVAVTAAFASAGVADGCGRCAGVAAKEVRLPGDESLG